MAMANYEIPQYPTQRLRYFNNQFLNDQDFIDDGAAQLGHERALLRSLCVAGVCEGMQVTYPDPNLPPSVSAGIAVDNAGRMIVVDRATDALAKPEKLADGEYFIHISFREIEDAQAAEQGASDFTRWKQAPEINATAKSAALPDGAVVLGSCTVQNNAFVGTGATVGRQYSGLRLPGLPPGAAATLRNTGEPGDLAVLAGSLTIRRDVSGQLGPTLTLLNGASGTGAGAGVAIDFDSYDPGSNDPPLRVRSLDDGSSSSHLTFWTKPPGAVTNRLVERLRLTSDGQLKFPNDSPKDKIVLWDSGPTARLGIGMNSGNINLFYPASSRFSLRQDSSSGTEVFSVSGSGTVSFSGPIDGSLTIRRNVSGQLGPKLTLLNGSGGAGAGGAIDFNGNDPGNGNDPMLRIQSLDSGNWSSHLTFSTKQPGAQTNTLVERLRLTSDGLLQFPNETKDKIIFWGTGSSRFGIGINSSNLNLFYPEASRFSLRQNSSTGNEVFSVNGSGAVTFFGPIVPKVGNDGNAGIYFPTNPGGGTGDAAFLRYYATSGETTKLVLGTDNDPLDALVLWQNGSERINISNNTISLTGLLKFPNEVPRDKIVIWEGGATDRFGIGLNANNINLFYPANARFSLRQNSSTGTEVFSVNASGAVTFSGPLVPKVGNNGSSGIYFPVDPGGGSGDAAFIRYYVESGETTKLLIGNNNDPDDRVSLYQFGGERLTIYNGRVGINTVSPTYTLHVNGNFAASSKNFCIDHPLDSRRSLVHSVVEGPEVAVFYRGEAVLVDGACEIALPSYFEALTRKENRTVLVTPKLSEGEETSALAASGVADGRFVVRAIDPRNRKQRFFWEVKGVRADIAPLEVEPMKPDFAPEAA